ncbi:MAG: TlpA family protein disulfide reductase [Chitinophagaceae bacterium]|jgi:peroxiredoxin|nr:TlpA family protein disulfide reductase [Chitinophagaceae bacterium]
MIKKAAFVFFCVSIAIAGFSQMQLKQGPWRVAIHRPDTKEIVFNLRVSKENGKDIFFVLNASEAMRIDNITRSGDSLFIDMPVFESGFRAKIISKDSLSGNWTRASGNRFITLPFTASANQPYRFPATQGNAKYNLKGKWAIGFKNDYGKDQPAIGVFTQEQNRITGSVLTPSGDDRYLEGIVSGDSVWLSTFDGVHAMVYAAKIKDDRSLEGTLYSGKSGVENFTAKPSKNPVLPNTSAMYVKNGEDGYLNFSFPDVDGNPVSLSDARFKNKVVVISLMGSWCPNCMDETAFLSDYYNKNKERGIEIIGLAYEYTTDFARSQKSVRKFQKRFDIQYPLLITGVAVTDTLRTEKTLPQLTSIKAFPSSIILDKTGKMYKIDTDFQGPGTGEYYTAYIKEFEKTIDKLLKKTAD